MLKHCIFDLLDKILPSSDRSKQHDKLRLEYLCACKIMESKSNILKHVPYMPASIFDLLLQSVIYNCYLKFINFGDISMSSFYGKILHRGCGQKYSEWWEREIVFPESLEILILNWPHAELILRNRIPSLQPPFEIFQNFSKSQEQNIYQVEEMFKVFNIFCSRLIHFIMKAVFKCAPGNTHVISCNLRRLDLSGLGSYWSHLDDIRSFSSLNDILEGIRNSKFDTLGHKIEIFADVEFKDNPQMRNNVYPLLSKIIQESLKPDVGVSVYFKKVEISLHSNYDSFSAVKLPSDLYNVLALGRSCEYIELKNGTSDTSSAEKFFTSFPKLVGISLPASYINRTTESMDFLSTFENLEQISLYSCDDYKVTLSGLTNLICNMSKGLKYLNLSNLFTTTNGSLRSEDFECLANSIHSETLLQLSLKGIFIENDSAALGLIKLCQKLINVKVLIVNRCLLDRLSSHSVSNLVKVFKDSVKLEFLSMRDIRFSLEITNVIIDGLAHNKSLRYLDLDLPEGGTCKRFHETINKWRNSPIYISWNLWGTTRFTAQCIQTMFRARDGSEREVDNDSYHYLSKIVYI